VVENFRRGVLERLGLHEAALRARFPRIILASISSQGETGPNRLHASFGSTLDATGGLSALTGYSGESPRVSGGDVNYPDQVVSLISTGLILAALRQVRETGRGVRLDISQREIVSFMVGEEIVAAGADPTRRGVRQGNAEDGLLLQDCWRCADGRWVAVTVTDAAQGAALARVLGVAVAARQNVAQPTNSLRTALSDWCQTRTADDAASTLAAAGLSAAPVLDGLDLLHAPHLTGASIAEDATGRMVKGMPYRFDHLPFCVHRQAPDLGADTDTVLREVLGLNDAAIARLAALGVTRTEP
jgi:benzylsuccinate CoA-transferase BbsF subunit